MKKLQYIWVNIRIVYYTKIRYRKLMRELSKAHDYSYYAVGRANDEQVKLIATLLTKRA